VEVLDRYLIS